MDFKRAIKGVISAKFPDMKYSDILDTHKWTLGLICLSEKKGKAQKSLYEYRGRDMVEAHQRNDMEKTFNLFRKNVDKSESVKMIFSVNNDVKTYVLPEALDPEVKKGLREDFDKNLETVVKSVDDRMIDIMLKAKGRTERKVDVTSVSTYKWHGKDTIGLFGKTGFVTWGVVK